ncbi:MAG: hypothetical protein SVO01_13110, partial [Thermotogota bacterium]|nr:hypothetical protein [Thermotogota bacterium]
MRNIFLIIMTASIGIIFYKVIDVYRRNISLQEYFLMNGNLKPGNFIGTMVSTNLSLGNFLYFCAIWSYFYGVTGMLWIAIGVILMIISFAIFGPKFKNFIEDRDNTGTIHEYLSLSYPTSSLYVGPMKLRLIASLSTIITITLAIVLELQLASQILAIIIGKQPWIIFFVVSAIACFVAAVGGYLGVAVTDSIQAILLGLALIAFFFIIFFDTITAANYSPAYPLNISEIIGSIGWWNIASIIVFGIGWPLVTMDTWQRNSASRSLSTASKGIIISGILMLIAVLGWSMVGIYDKLALSSLASHSQGFDPFSDLFLIATNTTIVKWSSAILATGLIMAALSTADTFFVMSGHSIVSDLIIGVLRRGSYGSLTNEQNLFFTNISRALIAFQWFIVLGVWFLLKDFGILQSALSLFFAAYAVQYSLLIPVLLSKPGISKQSGPAFWAIA